MTAPPELPGADTCMSCGRALRDPESRRLRLGPLCRKRLRAALTGPRPRLIGTQTATAHPRAIPSRPSQLAFETWDDEDDDPEDPYRPRPMADVPTGTLL